MHWGTANAVGIDPVIAPVTSGKGEITHHSKKTGMRVVRVLTTVSPYRYPMSVQRGRCDARPYGYLSRSSSLSPNLSDLTADNELYCY